MGRTRPGKPRRDYTGGHITYLWVVIVHAVANHSDLGAFPLDAGTMQLVNTGQVVLRVVSQACILAEALGRELVLAGSVLGPGVMQRPSGGDTGELLEGLEILILYLDAEGGEEVGLERLENLGAGSRQGRSEGVEGGDLGLELARARPVRPRGRGRGYRVLN